MSILHATPAPIQSLGGVPVPDYSEPVFSSGGVPDELSQTTANAIAKLNSFAAAHAEAELDEARNLLASTELSPAEFKALVEGECGPGRRWKVEAWAYVYSNHYGPRADQSRYHATMYASMDDKRGVPLKAESLRDLARLMIELDRHMASMPVVNLVAAV